MALQLNRTNTKVRTAALSAIAAFTLAILHGRVEAQAIPQAIYQIGDGTAQNAPAKPLFLDYQHPGISLQQTYLATEPNHPDSYNNLTASEELLYAFTDQTSFPGYPFPPILQRILAPSASASATASGTNAYVVTSGPGGAYAGTHWYFLVVAKTFAPPGQLVPLKVHMNGSVSSTTSDSSVVAQAQAISSVSVNDPQWGSGYIGSIITGGAVAGTGPQSYSIDETLFVHAGAIISGAVSASAFAELGTITSFPVSGTGTAFADPQIEIDPDFPDKDSYYLQFSENAISSPPLLTISPWGSGTLLTWQSHPHGFTLESTSDLASGNWVPVNLPVNDDGLTNTTVVPAQNGSLFFRLRQQLGNLQIGSASYGANGSFNDVTAIVQSYVINNSVNLLVNNDTMGGDPAFGYVKQLEVSYTYNGSSGSKSVQEGGTLILP